MNEKDFKTFLIIQRRIYAEPILKISNQKKKENEAVIRFIDSLINMFS